MNVHKSILETIGNTPLVELTYFEEEYQLQGKLYAKIESFNPGGSVKDRIAVAMILDAEKKGQIKKDTFIIEPTSGNTGIGLAMVCAAKGYHLIIVMPDSMSVERRSLLRAYGAELVLTEGPKGMPGAIEKAKELKKEYKKSFMPSQFSNEANPEMHFKTTGPEIYQDTDGKVDFFVGGVGTGGTISGVGKYLKSKKKDVKVIAVEPESSPVLSRGEKGPHNIQGIGAGFIPDTLDTSIYDEIYTVSNDEAMKRGKECARKQGLLVGISSGAAIAAAIRLGQKEEAKGKVIVVLLPDTGERYLSTEMFVD